jgi:two-component system sensor histidine kinase HydH
LRPQARQAGVEIGCADVDPSERLWGDPDLLLQVLMNLGLNAIQAGQHRGPVRIGCRLGENGAGTLLVEDRGSGVAEADRARLFTPFFTTKLDGTGLGLTVSADLVERHGGKLWLEPRKSGGTRAGLDLPGQPAVQAVQTTTAPEAAHA